MTYQFLQMKKILVSMLLMFIFTGIFAEGSMESTGVSANSGFLVNNGLRVQTVKPQQAQNLTDAELVAQAIKLGDCATLYEFTQKPNADKNLVAQANNTIKSYAAITGSKYPSRKMDAKIRTIPKDLAEKVFVDPKTNLAEVVAILTKGITDQFTKTKILHDWICDNIAYDIDIFSTGRISAQDYVSVLKKKKAVCSGYTNLMNEMCSIAGLESIGINGWSKGNGYTGTLSKNTDHAWNAVKIGGKWYLVDVTWDAGFVDYKTFIKRYSTEWLFLESRPFLYTHLPEDNAYQFYAPVLTQEQFVKEPKIAGSFFLYGLSLKSELPFYNNTTEGNFSFDIGMRTGVSLASDLRSSNQQDIPSASWEERKNSIMTYDFDVPDTKTYTGNIFARFTNEEKPQDRIAIGTFEREYIPQADALFNVENVKDRKISEKEFEYFKNSYFKVNENGYYYFFEDQFDVPRNTAVMKIHKLLDISTKSLEHVLGFNLVAANGYTGYGTDFLKYPNTYTNYNQLTNTQLISPKTGTLKAGETYTFAIFSSNYTSFAIVIDKEWFLFTKNTKTGNFELEFTVPEGIDNLSISGSPKTSGTHWGLVQYNVQ